jgi:formylglycine-generating enzyme required for sulfatase activity
VGSLSDCHGTDPPFSEVYDLSGNVREWVNSCTGNVGATDSCARHGGGIGADLGAELSDCSYITLAARNTTAPGAGIRCCADAAAP